MLIDGRPPRARLLTELRRQDFIAFLAKVFETVSPGDRFHLNWHLDAIAWELGQIERGVSTRLLVTMPPRNLKSIAISVAWVAWMLGHYPSTRIICVSYSEALSANLADMCKTVMLSDWYMATFPKTVLRGRAPLMDMKTTVGGGRYATSTGGTLTGRGANHIIIDDPIKPDDAFSNTIRQNCLDWYANTVSSRLNNKKIGSIVLVMQRIHEEDLAGHVIEEGGWNHLNLPAIAMEDDRIQIGPDRFYQRSAGVPLNPSHEDIATLLRQRRIMGSFLFSAQYQQQPIPASGLMVKRDWLRTYDHPPIKQTGDIVVQSWDTASRDGLTNDYSACVTALIRQRQVFVLNVFRGRLQFPALLAKTRHLAREWQIDALLIEEAVSGMQLIQSLREQPAADIPSPIARPTETSKEARMWGQTARIEAGELSLPQNAAWLDIFVLELLGFPKARHDDQVDALAHLLAWSAKRRDDVPVNVGPEIITVDDAYDGYEGNSYGYHDLDFDPWT